MIKDSNGQNTGFNLQGDDWDLENSKFTTIDLINSVFNYKNVTQSVNNAKFLWNIHYTKMKNGDMTAILAFTITTVLITTISLSFVSIISGITNKSQPNKSNYLSTKKVEEEEKEPPRDFTIEQLRKFDGTNNQPIYVSLKFDVFDVSQASGFYGPGSG